MKYQSQGCTRHVEVKIVWRLRPIAAHNLSVLSSRRSVCFRVCHLLHRQSFETSVVIRNGAMFPIVKILSVYSLRYCNRVVIFVKCLYGERKAYSQPLNHVNRMASLAERYSTVSSPLRGRQSNT